MNTFAMPKPIVRSKARLILGKLYYRTKRFINWYGGKKKFAKKCSKVNLANIHFKHQTPLLRQLKDVDMYLQYNKIINLKIAVNKINKTVIYPGETFSYWKLIGKPSKHKGYVEGMILTYGKYGTGIGGGLCQLSNLIFWITIHTPLKVTERHRHGFDVFPDSNRTQPFGSGATCYYNYLGLCITNETNHPFQLNVEVTNNELIGYWSSDYKPLRVYEVYEKEHYMKSEFWGGYSRHNILNRKIYDLDGNLIDDEYVIENHAIMMYEPFLESENVCYSR